MNKLISNIEFIIPLLDKSKDALLIGLLEEKKKLYKNKLIEKHLDNISITEKQKTDAIRGVNNSLSCFLFNTYSDNARFKKVHKKYNSIKKCYNCDYSVRNRTDIFYHEPNMKLHICRSCVKYTYKIQDIYVELNTNINRMVEETIDVFSETNQYNEFIELKAILNKIKRKLKTKKDETSKY
jgi:hypothetical protein